MMTRLLSGLHNEDRINLKDLGGECMETFYIYNYYELYSKWSNLKSVFSYDLTAISFCMCLLHTVNNA